MQKQLVTFKYLTCENTSIVGLHRNLHRCRTQFYYFNIECRTQFYYFNIECRTLKIQRILRRS